MIAEFFRPDGRHLSKAGITLLMLPFFALIFFAFLYPLVSLLSISVLEPQPTLENYRKVVDNPIYLTVLLRTLWIALLVSLLSLALAFPVAWLMARSKGPKVAFIQGSRNAPTTAPTPIAPSKMP